MPFEKFAGHPASIPPASVAGFMRPGATRRSSEQPSARSSGMPVRIACRVVRQMVAELLVLLGNRVLLRRDRRRHACHVRQIAMYVCHVALRISLSEIGEAFGRDRTTVGHACHVVEDRRDDDAFDDFVAAVERIATAVFGIPDLPAAEFFMQEQFMSEVRADG